MKKLVVFLSSVLLSGLSIAQQPEREKKVNNPNELAYEFDKNEDDVVMVPHQGQYDIGSGEFTIEALVQVFPNINSYPQILSNRSSTDVGFLIGIWNDGRPYMRIGQQNFFYNVGDGLDVRDGQCHHLAFSRDENSLISLYIDGILNAQVTTSASLNSSSGLSIGNDFESSGVAFNGTIKEVKLWSVHHTEKQVNDTKETALVGTENDLIGYWKLNETDGQTAIDYSSYQNNGFLGGSTNVENSDPKLAVDACAIAGFEEEEPTVPVATEGYYFNSTERDVVQIPNHSSYAIGQGEFTMEAIINATKTGNSYPQILSNRSSTDVGFLFGIWDDGRPYMRIGVENFFYGEGSGVDIRDNECHHLAFSRDAQSVVSLYIDGVLDATVLIPSSINSTHDLWIGNDYQGGNVAFEGVIKEVRFWNKGRTASEILANKDFQLIGTETGLVGYWKLNEENQVISDYSVTQNHAVLGSTPNIEVNDPEYTESCGSVLAVGDAFSENKISIYPNPTASKITVVGGSSAMEIKVYNTTGILIKETVGETVNLEGLIEGLYFVHINDVIFKVMKN